MRWFMQRYNTFIHFVHLLDGEGRGIPLCRETAFGREPVGTTAMADAIIAHL